MRSLHDNPLRFRSYSLMCALDATSLSVEFSDDMSLAELICLSMNILVTPRMNFPPSGVLSTGKSFLSLILMNSSACCSSYPSLCIKSRFACEMDFDSCDSLISLFVAVANILCSSDSVSLMISIVFFNINTQN